MKDFEDNVEGIEEPFVFFKDYEEMNDKFIKEYKKKFKTGKEYQFDLIEGLDISKLMSLNNVQFKFVVAYIQIPVTKSNFIIGYSNSNCTLVL